MGYRNVYLLTLMLAAVQNMMAYPAHVGSSSSLDMLPLANEYLGHLFQTIEDWGRQPNANGEVNLLPEETNRFANMVQCIPEEPNPDKVSENSMDVPLKRVLTYNLIHNFISSTQKLVAFRLVIPALLNPAPAFEVRVYDEGLKHLASKSFSTSKNEEYMDFHIALFDHPNKFPLEEDSIYELVLEISGSDDSTDSQLETILSSLKPMLVVYSYDSDLLKNLFRVPGGNTSNVLKRSTSETADQTTVSLEEAEQEFCQVHSFNLTSFEDILSPLYEVISPAYITVGFCDGHCRHDGNVENAEQITRHAEFVGRMDPQLREAGITPCCIPTSYGYTNLELTPKNSGNVFMIIIENHVNSCGCY